MASIGKKILSAFMEITDDHLPVKKPADTHYPSGPAAPGYVPPPAEQNKFRQYFENLFKEANLPGPDYYEFSKMIEAMKTIPDESARYSAAFAGLQVQGLDREKLLTTASAYLQVLDKDAGNFLSTVDAAMQEKVVGKNKAIEEKALRMQALSAEISDLQNQVTVLKNEVKENEEKIVQSTGGYKTTMEQARIKILTEIEKIKSFIQ